MTGHGAKFHPVTFRPNHHEHEEFYRVASLVLAYMAVDSQFGHTSIKRLSRLNCKPIRRTLFPTAGFEASSHILFDSS